MAAFGHMLAELGAMKVENERLKIALAEAARYGEQDRKDAIRYRFTKSLDGQREKSIRDSLRLGMTKDEAIDYAIEYAARLSANFD
jgi:hypothetical protein